MSTWLPPLRTLLPAEHGTWFMLGFPLVLGLLLAPTGAALALALAALSAFLARPALRRVLTGPRDPRQVRALLLCGSVAFLLGLLTWTLSDARFLIPLGLVSPLAIVALRADLDRSVRSLPVELAAQGAFAGLAAALVMTGGATGGGALRVGWLAALVGGANLAHVRRWLGHAHGLAPGELAQRRLPVHVLHGLLIVSSALLLAPRGLAGWAWTAWTLGLYLRALVPYRPVPARILGWREGGLSVLSLLLLWRALA